MTKRTLYTLLLLLCPGLGIAQLLGGNAFLQGQYIRLGMAPNGAFGSTTGAPVGFLPAGADKRNFPACNQGRVGFVADPDKDGWDVGTPAFAGEYFLPGTPEEGWAVSMNGLDFNNNRSTEFITQQQNYCTDATQIPGGFVDFQDLPTKQVAVWEGMVNGLSIHKEITLPKNKLYFVTDVTFVNTTGSTMRDVYYMRNVDPDNEVVPTGSFKTVNRIEFQNPLAGSKALVSARGEMYNTYLGLGTIDCRARVCIKGSSGDLANRHPRDVYDGLDPHFSQPGDKLRDDVAIAIAFKLGDIAPGASVHFAFAYVLSQADLEEGMSKTALHFNVNGTTLYTGAGVLNCSGAGLPISIVNGDDYTWNWSPAAGLNTTTGPSVIYNDQPKGITYTASGTNGNCTDTKLTITVYPPNSVISNFKAESDCGTNTVSFKNLSPEANYFWEFGDGKTSTETSPVHVYPAKGSYQVKLTLTVPTLPTCGNVLTSTQTVVLKEAPVMSFTYQNACAGQNLQLSGTASVPGGFIATHQWTLPGGMTMTGQNISTVVAQPGAFNFTYEATTDQGCTGLLTKNIIVESVPVAAFSTLDGCTGKSLTIGNQSKNDSGAIQQYTWDMGNGQTATGAMPSIIYSAPGNYSLQLMATTRNGCSGTASQPVNIEMTPVADFSWSPACINSPVIFLNRSAGPIISHQWDFDDNLTTSIINPVHTFTREKNFKVSLSVRTANGCASTVVNGLVIAKTRPFAGIDTLVFKDTDFRLHATGGIRYLWTPASLLNNATIANPTGRLQSDQVFNVIITDQRGCVDSDQVKVTVFDHDDIYIPSAFSPNGDGFNDVLRVIAPTQTVTLFEIFDRWGKKVFVSYDQAHGWDGKVKGIVQPGGIYVWYCRAKTRTGVNVEKKGWVMLMQ